MNILIIGATSRIAECTARALVAAHPAEDLRFLLVGRQPERVQPIADDLVAIGAGRVSADVLAADLGDLQALPALVAQCVQRLGTIDLALIAHGTLPDQQVAQQDAELAEQTLRVNGVSPVLIAERLVESMLSQGKGSLVVIGSVAGDRGRKSNYLYGAAKGLVDRYMEGLRHRLHGSAVYAMLIKPGPTKTPMTDGMGIPASRLATPEHVAKCILQGIQRRRAVVYAPVKWRLIMLVIRHLPGVIFNRLPI